MILNISVIISQEAISHSDITFENIIELEGENLILEDIPLVPEALHIDDNSLLVLDIGGDNYFKVYSLSDFKLQGNYGPKGYGPGEIGYQPELSFFNEDTIEFFDFQKSSISRILIQETPPKVETIQVLHPDLIEAQQAIRLFNHLIAGSGSLYGNMYFFDTKTKTINFSPFLEITKTLPEQHINIFNEGEVTSTPDRKKIIYASRYFEHFDIFNYRGNKEYTYSNASLENQVFMKNSRIYYDNTNLYYSTTYATESHFYLLYLGGNSYNNLLNKIETNEFTCEIQQFSLTGSPKNCYIIDIPIKAFCVDEENNRIIGINPLSEGMPLVSFNMDKPN